jgi:pyruvate/2-oxoglutarate dehydrogenase complex dihydrolipoamide acyltransferase (E2) component
MIQRIVVRTFDIRNRFCRYPPITTEATVREIRMPALGVGMEEGLLIRWLKQPGDIVAADEGIAEIETDKATVELPSPASGRLGEHLFEEEALIPIGATMVVLYEEGDDPPDPAP